MLDFLQELPRRVFSRFFMMAKTILLAKVDTPLSMHHARPITILSSLYRVCSKFVFKFTAGRWKDFMPFPISGGLPCRGVKELAFAQKRVIEKAITDGKSIGGFSLDLIKAYNTFGRMAVIKIMHRLGMPWELLHAWVKSLDMLVRYPCINGHFAKGIESTTGVPEGCSMSVLSMIATSALFYFRMKNEHINPYAYADNWSWMSMQQRVHFIAYEMVLHLTKVLRLSIDFSKSWHWGTTKTFRESCKDVAQHHADDGIQITIRTSVKDLGEIVHYDKSASLGFVQEKIQEGILRLQRIEWLPCALQKKAQYIQSAVWPLSLYSADTVYIGQRHFEKLRRSALNALVGHWHSASSIMACNFLSGHLCDPFLHVLCQCVRIIRRLSTVAPDIAVQTVQDACSYTGSRPYGPASTFKQYLKCVDWTMHENGDIIGPDHFTCNVLRDPTKKLVNMFKLMWNHHVLQSMSRKGVGDFLPDVKLAAKVFCKLKEDEQQLVKMNVVGGFQTHSVKAKWDSDTCDKCVFCGALDTREHRLLDCIVGMEIREDFASACDILKNQRPEWVYLPIPRQHEMCLLLRAYLKLIKPPIIPMPVHGDGQELRFFTDGGAINPTSGWARIATWSVVQDISVSQDQRFDVSGYFLGPQPKFPCFKVAALGVVHGEQTVSRGELLALVTAARIACKHEPPMLTEFVTDASYVCNIVRLVKSGFWRHIAHKLPNIDIIKDLADIWRNDLFFVTKVKSHRSFSDARDHDDLWYIAGNFCADLAATLAFKVVPVEIRSLADQIFKHVKDEEVRLRDVFSFLACINKVRCEALHKHEMEHGKPSMQIPKNAPTQQDGNCSGLFNAGAMGDDALQFMMEFNPVGYQKQHVDQVDDAIFASSLQGANVAKATFLWLQTLEWPTNVDEPDPSDWGISWFELAVSFYLYTGFRFPIKVSGAGNKSVYIAYDSDDALLLQGRQRSAVLQSICLKNMVQNLLTLLQQPVFPQFGTFKCRSLTRLGMTGVIAGVSRRPKIPNPAQTMQFVRSYLDGLKGVAFENPIHVKNLEPQLTFDPIPEPSPAQRYNNYAVFMKRLRKVQHSAVD